MNAASHPLATAKYVSLTTFRRNGDGVSTPVWIAPSGDDLVFVSVDNTGKTKRLKNNDRVELRACDLRGNVAPDAVTYSGTATVDRTPGGIARIREAVVAKYGLPARFADLGTAAAKLVGKSLAPRAGIVIRPDAL